MNPALRYQLTKAGTIHNLPAPAGCQVDPATSRTGTPRQLEVFAGGHKLQRCQRCEAAETASEASAPASPATTPVELDKGTMTPAEES